MDFSEINDRTHGKRILGRSPEKLSGVTKRKRLATQSPDQWKIIVQDKISDVYCDIPGNLMKALGRNGFMD